MRQKREPWNEMLIFVSGFNYSDGTYPIKKTKSQLLLSCEKWFCVQKKRWDRPADSNLKVHRTEKLQHASPSQPLACRVKGRSENGMKCVFHLWKFRGEKKFQDEIPVFEKGHLSAGRMSRAYLRGYGSPQGYISPNSEFNFGASVKSWHGSWGNGGKSWTCQIPEVIIFSPLDWFAGILRRAKCQQSALLFFFFFVHVHCCCVYLWIWNAGRENSILNHFSQFMWTFVRTVFA